MKIKFLGSLIGLFLFGTLHSQYDDYVGAGHTQDIIITSSSDSDETDIENIINGQGFDHLYFDASRFLMQATLGYEKEHVDQVMEMGIEAWIDQQIQEQPTLMLPKMEDIWEEEYQLYIDNGLTDEEIFGPSWVQYDYAWWDNNMKNDDLLRQRVAYALSQILVISKNSQLSGMAPALCDYYDLLIKHAFGNYRDLLMDVTLHSSMGYYLSHLNNPKAIPEENIHPDENYAREIMQLFTIGLYELNTDGSRKLDTQGNPIPTYDNNDIKELAKVFTGLGPGGITEDVWWADEPYFGLGIYGMDFTVPLAMYQDFHETQEKTLLNGLVIPANQDGMTDIEMAVDNLINHQNTGPFVSYRLIQRLVTSNPTNAYVQRVAEVFNDNGQGVKGDLTAVIKAILLDDEARSIMAMQDPENGKLKEPFVRYTQLSRWMDKNSVGERYWNIGYQFYEDTKQNILESPTVFNFYPPDFQPVGQIADNGLVAPEFKIHNTSTSVGWINSLFRWLYYDYLMYDWISDDYANYTVTMNYDRLIELADDSELLINELDRQLLHGQLSDQSRQIIREQVNQLYWTWDENWKILRVKLTMYLLLSSADYNIQK